MKFDPTTLSYTQYCNRLILGPLDGELPDKWIARRMPRPSLPVDIFLQKQLQQDHRRSVLRTAGDLEAQHPLGNCPYALARSGIAHAALHSLFESHRDYIRSELIDPLKHLKNTPKLSHGIRAAYPHAHFLLKATEHFDIEIPHLKSIAEALLVLEMYLPKAQAAISTAHLDLSQHAGNVWRLSFIRGLACVWWRLAGQDPVPSAGPFQEFVISAWCSLSPDASPTDADWRSAIKTAMARPKDTPWRVPALSKNPQCQFDNHVTTWRTAKRLDDFVELRNLEDQANELRERLLGRRTKASAL